MKNMPRGKRFDQTEILLNINGGIAAMAEVLRVMNERLIKLDRRVAALEKALVSERRTKPRHKGAA
jgi:hypothetical protein